MRSEYSILDSINKINDLPKLAKQNGQNSISCTDHGSVGGLYKFIKACRKEDIRPIAGLEAYWTHDMTKKEKDADGESYYHFLLLALDNKGLKNLYTLSSKAHTEGFYSKPRLDNNLLVCHTDGLCASTACLGSYSSQLLLSGQYEKAKKVITEWKEIFSGRLLVELEIGNYTSKGREKLTEIKEQIYSEEQILVNQQLIKIANELDLPLIVTNDVHYGLKSQQKLHDIALCVQTNSPRSSEKRFSFRGLDCHFANAEWISNHCRNLGIPEEAITNTSYVAELINDKDYLSDTTSRFPTYKDTPAGLTSWEHLEVEAQHGLYDRFNGMPPKEYRDRLDYELKQIKQMGFSDYILIVAQVIQESWRINSLPGPGRGSSAGSLACWAMGITQINPIKYGLFFERFLSFGRSPIPLIFTKEMKEQL